MPITTWWYDTQQPITVSRFEGDWVWGDFWQAMEDLTAMIKSVNGPVHMAVDMSANTSVPGDAIQGGQRAFKHLATMENLQLIVFVNCNAYEDAIVRALVLLFPDFNRKVVFADSLDEALQLLANTRVAVA